MTHPSIRLTKLGASVFLGLIVPSNGQQIINGSRTLLGNWDASGAATTKPVKAGTTIPASCGIGEIFFKTDANPGANLYLCTTGNIWVQVQGGVSNFSQISGTATAGQLPASIQYFLSGTGAPGAACTAGQNAYLDTTNLDYWFCDAANAWKKVLSTTNTGPFALTGQTGTAPATPAAGFETVYLSGTDKTLHTVSDAGTDTRYAGLSEANTWGAYLQDFSASTMRLPVAAGFTAATNGGIGYDSTANQLHTSINSTDSIIPNAGTTAPTSGNCVRWGTNFQLQDGGTSCGGGSPLATTGSGYILPFYVNAPTNSANIGANVMVVWQFVASQTITVNTIIGVNKVNATGTYGAFGLYTDSSGSCGALIAQTTPFSVAVASGTSLQGALTSPVTLVVGKVYWIAAGADSPAGGMEIEVSNQTNALALMNQTNHPRIGKAGNATSGATSSLALPTSCGTLNTSTNWALPNFALMP